MTTTNSVVTPERYASGMGWQEYLDFIKSPENMQREMPNGGERPDNAERWQRNVDQYEMKPEHVEALKKLPKMKLLVIGEDWCPDVYRGVPVFAKIAETAGWEFRMFARDLNKDIMAEFLNVQGDEKYESIPVAVVYTEDQRYVGHFIERPKVANQHMAKMQQMFKREEGESEDEMRARIRKAYQDLQQSDEWANWRHATVDEILELAQKA